MSDRAREALQHRLLTARDEPERASLVAALSRIDAGTFGFCTKCHGSIGRHRLVAMPEASCCLTCSSQE